MVPFEALVDGDLIVAQFNDGGGTKTAPTTSAHAHSRSEPGGFRYKAP